MTKQTLIFTSILLVFLYLGGCSSSSISSSSPDGDAEAIDDDISGTGGDMVVDGDEDHQYPVVAYPVVETGQTHCYDLENEIDCPAQGQLFAGQDAQHLGRKMSFQDNGDGTISDLVTGLMWEQTPSSQSFGWQEALDYCNALSFADHDDWRAPSLKELFSISDFGTGWPYIDLSYFNLAQSGSVSKDEQYWSSNFYVAGTTHGGQATAFGVNHGTGHIKGYPSEASGPMGNYVRCVRGNEYGINQLVNNGDGTVTDETTGFIWTQADNGSGIEWKDALAYCENLTLAGNSDWRLPDVKELQSIVDYSGNLPAIDPMFSVTGITNEAGDADFPYFWTSTSAYFGANQPEYYYAWYVAFGFAVDGEGNDTHGAGAVRFDTKVEGGPLGEGGERYHNYVRCVRAGAVTTDYDSPVDGDSPADGDEDAIDGDGPPVDGDTPPVDGDGPGDEPISCEDAQPGMPCCGDDVCDGPETADNCPVDCAAVDGDEPVGPVSCEEDADCQVTGACPEDAALGCICASTPEGDFCIPSCSTSDDCPASQEQAFTCSPEGICIPQGGPQH